MNTKDSSRRPDPRDPLDELLHQAAFPEPDPQSMARLEQHWKQISAGRHRAQLLTRRWLWISAIAAGLLVAVTLWWFRGERGDVPPELAQPERETLRLPVERPDSLRRVEDFHPVDSHPVGSPQPVILPREPVVKRDEPVVARGEIVRSRPANAYEMVVFHAALRRRQAATMQDRSAELKSALQKLVDDPPAATEDVAKRLLPEREIHERLLIRLIPELEERSRPAAITLLARVGSRRSVPLLMELSRNNSTHRPAVQALARLSDAAALERVILNESDAELRRVLLSALVSRNEPVSLSVYLNFVHDPATASEALAVLDEIGNPPVDLLFDSLASSQQMERLAAARVLGRLSDTEVDRRLIRIAESDITRQEVLLALLTSESEEALRFLQRAQDDLFLVAAVRTARFQLQTLAN